MNRNQINGSQPNFPKLILPHYMKFWNESKIRKSYLEYLNYDSDYCCIEDFLALEIILEKRNNKNTRFIHAKI